MIMTKEIIKFVVFAYLASRKIEIVGLPESKAEEIRLRTALIIIESLKLTCACLAAVSLVNIIQYITG